MANRRMFSKDIVQSDVFLDMPKSSQLLYFHISMEADDDGFVGSPKKVMRYVGASDDDLKILIVKRFLIAFNSGVCVIKHRKMNNYLQKDRVKPTVYTEEKKQITTKPNNAYTERETQQCIQDVYIMDTQYSIDKDSIDYIRADFADFFELIREKYRKGCKRMQRPPGSKQNAKKKYMKIVTNEEMATTLDEKVEQYLAHCEAYNQFPKHFITWLNQKGRLEDYDIEGTKTPEEIYKAYEKEIIGLETREERSLIGEQYREKYGKLWNEAIQRNKKKLMREGGYI